MTLLNRYIFKEFIRFFLVALTGILIVYLCVDFLQKADDFITYKAKIYHVMAYFLYNLPAIATPSIPIAALLATLLSLGNLSRHNEITAMYSGGISLLKIIRPVVAGGMLISALGFVNNELIMPPATSRANYIRNEKIEKKPHRVAFRLHKLWLLGPDNSIANIDITSPDRYEMLGVNIYKLNPDYTVRERIKADSLVWENGAWRLKGSRKYLLMQDRVVSLPADDEIYNVVESPADLKMIIKPSEEMSFGELWDYVRRLKVSGYNLVRYEVDLYGKLAFPLSSLLMVLIATPLSLHKARSGGYGRGIALAVLIAFAYWSLSSVGSALGRSGSLPPVAAAWFANVLFASASGFVLYRMQKTN